MIGNSTKIQLPRGADLVSRDFVQSLAGEIKLPITRLESSLKSARGIHIADLALYLDLQRDAARKECAQLNKTLRPG